MVLKVRKLNAMRFPKTTDTGNSALNELDNCLNLFGRNRKVTESDAQLSTKKHKQKP